MVVAILYTCHSLWGGSSNRGLDAHVFYLGGMTWISGESAYDRSAYVESFAAFAEKYGARDDLNRSVFVCPPTVAPLALGLAFVGWPKALILLEILQILAYLALAYFCIALTRRPEEHCILPQDNFTVFAIVAGFCFGAVNATMLFGQLGLIALAGAVGAVHAWRNGRVTLTVTLLIVASVKPQISFMFVPFLLGAGAWKPVLWAAVVSIVMMFIMEMPAGMSTLPERLSGSFAAYQGHSFNSDPSNRIGIVGLLRDPISISAALTIGLVSGSALSFWLGYLVRGNRLAIAPAVSIVLLLSVLVVPVFTYDFVAGSALLLLARYRTEVWIRAVVVLMLIFSAKPNGVERLLVTFLPLPDALESRLVPLLVIGSLLVVVALLVPIRLTAEQRLTTDSVKRNDEE